MLDHNQADYILIMLSIIIRTISTRSTTQLVITVYAYVGAKDCIHYYATSATSLAVYPLVGPEY